MMYLKRTTVYNHIVSDDKYSQVSQKNKDLIEDYLDYLVSIDRSPSTILQYRNDLKIFFCWNLDYNENKYFVDLTKRDVARFQKHAMTEWGWSSNRLSRVKSCLSSMSTFIENMMDDEFENYRPIVRKVETPIKQPIREKTVISDDEVNMVLDNLVNEHQYQAACAFALAAFSGARKSELLRFKVSYFNDENIMKDAALYMTPEKIKTKGRGASGKALTKYTLLDFKKYFDLWMNERKEKGLTDCEYLFIKMDGQPMSTAGLDSYTEKIAGYLGRPFYFHALRHQLCSRLFRIGLPADVIQEYFGWNSADMLRLYNDTDASESFGKYFTSDGIKGSDNTSLSDI